MPDMMQEFQEAGESELHYLHGRASEHCKFAQAGAGWIVKRKRRPQTNVHGREYSAGKLMNIVEVDMNVYDLGVYITMAVNG
jgi:hypothetical protein